MGAMIGENDVRKWLIPFDLKLTSGQLGQLIAYLDLLLYWNRKINLTAVRSPRECVTRHFGESLYLARWVELNGANLDVGSGAGFPGLALKIVFPNLRTTLLEPVAKKRAFLKEVIRSCEIEAVEVRPVRLEELVGCGGRDIDEGEAKATSCFDSVTARAVGRLPSLVGTAACLLKAGGQLCLWVSRGQSTDLVDQEGPVTWRAPIAIPLSARREILTGVRLGANSACFT